MLIWEQYDKDTWGVEWEALDRLALIKRTDDDQYTCLVGTLSEMEWNSVSGTLAGAKALCLRYMLLIKNCDPDRVRHLSYKL